MRALVICSAVVAVVVVGACDGGAVDIVLPDVQGAHFSGGTIDNTFNPLPRNAVWHYKEGDSDVTVRVLADTKVINGIVVTQVQDTLTNKDGDIEEDTTDYFAQDDAGTVWYMGEDTCEYEGGVCTSTEGSWQYGKNGALPGVIMPAKPTVDHQPYRQEFLPGHAEDVGEVVALDQHVEVAKGVFDGCVKTHDTSTLEAAADESKFYCPGIGVVEELDGTKKAAELVSTEGI